MKKRITMLLLVLTVVAGHAQVQSANAPKGMPRDSVAYQATFNFKYGVGDWIQPKDYLKMAYLILWAKSNTTTFIEIIGWADESGTLEQNGRISLRRARTIQCYLIKKGIAAHRISIEGRGVDTQSISDEKARRADVRGVIRLVAEPQPAEPAEAAATAKAASDETAKTPIKEEIQPAVQPKEEVVQPKEAEQKPIEPKPVQ